MKLSDYLVQYLVDKGIHHAFLVIGGACAHIVDSLGKNKDMQYVCFQHEQAAAMAVDAYSRVTKNTGVAVATSGPGATNLITGMCCLWFDSIPCIFITGQVNAHETKGERKVRQIGFQETDIVEMVRPITKYAVMVTDPKTIKHHLDKAFHEALSGRPGPVLIDIPLDVQHADVDPDTLEGFTPNKEKDNFSLLRANVKKAIELLQQAKRPVIICGMGIKIAGAVNEFRSLAEALGVPIISTWSGLDILPHGHPLYFGQFGVYGNRGSNFLVQNSDLVLAIGSRLDTRPISGNGKSFARGAKKIVVDVDESELKKGITAIDMPIVADAGDFIRAFAEETGNCAVMPDISEWVEQCGSWKKKYPSVLPEYYAQKKFVNPYVFVKTLSEELGSGDVIVADEGGNLVWAVQAFEVKEGQEFFSAFAHSPMGYSFPASIGAYFALQLRSGRAGPKRRVVCLDGDGGFQMNIQEFQTIKNYNVPVKIFILNNNAYGIIKQFQEIYFDGRYTGTTNDSGYTAPDFVKVAEAYGISAVRISGHDELREKIRSILDAE